MPVSPPQQIGRKSDDMQWTLSATDWFMTLLEYKCSWFCCKCFSPIWNDTLRFVSLYRKNISWNFADLWLYFETLENFSSRMIFVFFAKKQQISYLVKLISNHLHCSSSKNPNYFFAQRIFRSCYWFSTIGCQLYASCIPLQNGYISISRKLWQNSLFLKKWNWIGKIQYFITMRTFTNL